MQLAATRCSTAPRPAAALSIVTRGRYHDLAAIYDELNQAYFGGRIEARPAIWQGRVAYMSRDGQWAVLDEKTGQLTDIPEDDVEIGRLPTPPAGSEIERVEVIVRLRATDKA